MESIDIKTKEIKKMIKRKEYLDNNNCLYLIDGLLYKFYQKYIFEIISKKKDTYGTTVNLDQIYKLCMLRNKVKKSELPLGIVSVDHVPSGVIYKYFEGYKSFEELYKEDSDVIFANLLLASEKNIELIENGIYNTDMIGKNILYKGNDVELIDLDGKYIKFKEFYLKDNLLYFLDCMFKIVSGKIYSQYSEEDALRIIKEISPLFNEVKLDNAKNPVEVINNIEKMRILKK